MRIFLGVPIIFAGSLLVGSVAHADEASDRRRAMSDIERLLSDMARSLSGLAGSSSTSGVDSALRSADRLKSKLRDLERVKGNDSKAREMVSRYPRNISRLKEVRRPLQDLKKGQRGLKTLADDCKRRERDLQRLIKDEVRRMAPDSERTLRDKAKGFGREIEGKLRKASDQKRTMDRAKDKARRFDASEGKWRDVKSNVRRAADRMYDDWKRDYEKGKRACEKLGKGDRHPDVNRALDTIKRQAQQRTELIKRAQTDLKQVVSQTKGLDSARDTGPLKRVAGSLRNTTERIKALSKVKGSDPTAGDMVKGWPKAESSVRTALDALIKLKGQQFSLDKMADGCVAAEKALLAQAKTAVAKPEAKTRDALKAAAKAAGKSASDGLEDAAKRADQVKRLQSSASRAQGPGDWRAAAGNLKASADRMAAHFRKAHDTAKSRCGELAKGERHKDIAKALDQIADVLERVDRMFKTLEGDVKALAGQVKSGDADRARSTALKLHGQLEKLRKDTDPRAQQRSAQWLAGFGKLDTALKGLKTLTENQGKLAADIKECESLNARADQEARKLENMQQLEGLEKAAGPFGKTTQKRLADADKLKATLAKAKSAATGFNFSEGAWGGVRSGFKGAADKAFGAFGKAHDQLKTACGEMVKGARHKTIANARKTLTKQVSTAEKAMLKTRKDADAQCGTIKGLAAKRDKRAQALQVFVGRVLEKNDMSVKPSLIKTLQSGLERATKELDTASKACAKAMQASTTADTAWEALHGR